LHKDTVTYVILNLQMNKKVLVGFIAVTILAGVVGGFFIFSQTQKVSSPLPLENTKESKETVLPSATLKQYSDPAGFSFSYPDDLSLSVSDNIDTSTYADITLTSKKTNGTIRVIAIDTKFASVGDWLKSTNAISSKEVTLAGFKASEVKKEDGLLLTAVDSGVLFTLESSFAGQDQFWINVYNNILSSFSFNSTQGVSDVVFEGEETVE